jgi:IS30 family transposase
MKDGKTQSQIAKLMDRHKSTISRELARNTGNRGYRPRQACLLAEERSLGSRNATQITASDWGKAVDCLLAQWSPEQIADQVGISHETIYRHVYADKAAGGSLWEQLRCQKKRKKRYASGRDRRGQIVGRRPISERPQHIEARSQQIGYWEGATVISAAHKQAVLILVTRKSGYAVLDKVRNKTLNLIISMIIAQLAPLTQPFKKLTFANKKEFAEHQSIDYALKSTAYFADPFANWQRGSNGNFNGLLRQYIPKKRSLSTVTDKGLRMP